MVKQIAEPWTMKRRIYFMKHIYIYVWMDDKLTRNECSKSTGCLGKIVPKIVKQRTKIQIIVGCWSLFFWTIWIERKEVEYIYIYNDRTFQGQWNAKKKAPTPQRERREEKGRAS